MLTSIVCRLSAKAIAKLNLLSEAELNQLAIKAMTNLLTDSDAKLKLKLFCQQKGDQLATKLKFGTNAMQLAQQLAFELKVAISLAISLAIELQLKGDKLATESYWQDVLHRQLGGTREVSIPYVGRIDLLTHDRLIEVKLSYTEFKHALGQVLCYAISYPKHKPTLAFASMPTPKARRFIENVCMHYKVDVLWLTNEKQTDWAE